MRTFVIIAVLGTVGYFGFKAATAESEAFVAFKKFMEWQRNGNCGEMRGLTEEQALQRVEELCAPVGRTSAASMIADLNSTPSGAMRSSVYKVEEEKKAAGGAEVTMVIKESVRGRSSAMNPLPPPRRHTVKARKSGSAWKLVELSAQ
ncbi:MAG: hypothetical protein HY924_17035 [Elusimicrobia bacterium]|nr:hypothetical protein [Elusimicrobiota bacterium]